MTVVGYPVTHIRQAEAPLIDHARAAGDPDAVMRRAAHGVAHHSLALIRQRCGRIYGSTVLVLAGSGDNGGDALYAGAVLARRGCRVVALAARPDTLHQRARTALTAAGGRVSSEVDEVLADIGRYDMVIDGIVGIGGSGGVRAPLAHVVRALAHTDTVVVAVDVPSGIDADTGVAHEPHVQATCTVTFGLRRRAHLVAAPHCGRTHVVDIGPMSRDCDRATTVSTPDPGEVGRSWPVPGRSDDKYTQGVVAVRAGSAQYPGAAVLATSAAVAATSGMVRYIGPCADEVLAMRPEVVCHDSVTVAGRCQAWVAGPGMGTDSRARAELEDIVAQNVPTVFDADALTIIAIDPAVLEASTAPVVLTPHAGEFARLSGEPLGADRAGELRRYVASLRDRGIDATVLLKGRVTLVDDGVHLMAVDAGSSWAATAGSGDVLSGIVGALAAHGAAGHQNVQHAAADAAVVHAVAARIAATRYGTRGVPIRAEEIANGVPAAIAYLRK